MHNRKEEKTYCHCEAHSNVASSFTMTAYYFSVSALVVAASRGEMTIPQNPHSR